MSEPVDRTSILVNIVGYYAGWTACILGAARGYWGWGAAIGVILVIAHLGLARRRDVEIRLLLITTVIGYAVDSAQTALGLLVFPAGQPAWWLAPVWIGVVWMLFSGTLRYSFHWLSGRPWLAAAFGAVGGPAAFYAGHRLGAVEFHPTAGLSLAVLALVWAALFPLLIHLSAIVGGPGRGTYRRGSPAGATVEIRPLEKRIVRAESALIALSIGAIAVVDYAIGAQTSLGPLYLIPLCYSALSQRRAVTLSAFVVCLILRELLGPIEQSSDPMFFFVRDLVIAAGFVAVALNLSRLGSQRHEFFELARRQRDDLATEVRLAAQLQSRLLQLNRAETTRLDIYASTAPLKGVGGDYYDFLRLGPDRVGIVVADVAGKGLTAAMLMPAVRIALHSLVQRLDDPRRVVAALDRMIFRATTPESYTTLFLATVDLESGRLECVNAGHLPALLVDPDGSVQWLGKGGPPVGLLPTAEYDSEIATLEPGGNLVLYTDGVTESQNAEGVDYGMERLAALVAGLAGRRSERIVDAIRHDLLEYVGGGSLADDATAIAIRRQLPHESPGETGTDFIETDSYPG